METTTEEMQQCPVCAKPYVNPKRLACHHTLCEPCVNKVKTATKIQCPTCQNYSDVSQVIADVGLQKLVHATKGTEDENTQASVGEPLKTTPGPCELCTKHPFSFHCEDCSQWICSDCKTIHLRIPTMTNHNIKQLDDKNKEAKATLETYMTELEKKIQEYRKCVTAFSNEKDKTQSNQIKLLKESRELRDACALDLHNRFNKIDAEIINKSEAHIQVLHKGFVKFDKLTELQNEWTQMNDILKMNKSQLAIDGESILKRAKQLVDSVESPDVPLARLDIQVCKGDAWDASQAVTLRVGGNNVYQGSSGETVVTANKKSWVLTKQVTTPLNPRSLRLIQQQLWQCCENECIQIYDTALAEQRRIQCEGMGYVFDVAGIHTGDVVVAASTGLYHINTQGKRLHEIHSGWFTGVAVHEGLVYAAQRDEARVYSYKYSNDWQLHHDFNLQCTPGYTITLSVINSSIIACLCFHNRIDVLTLAGDKQYSAGERGSQVGQLYFPYLCSSDPSGAMLVADCNNGRLQVMDASRQWNVVNLLPQPQHPWGAVLHAGKLYCNARNKEELYMYE